MLAISPVSNSRTGGAGRQHFEGGGFWGGFADGASVGVGLALGFVVGFGFGGGGVYGACPVLGAWPSTLAAGGKLSALVPASTPCITARQV